MPDKNPCPVSFLFLVLLAAGCSKAPQFHANATLEDKISITHEHLQTPGAVVGIYRGEDVLYEAALGKANIANAEPLTTDHRFRVGSLAKMFVAHVLLQLVDQGRIGLDDSVAAYLPDLQLDPRVTLRQLANHTSGLPNYIADARVKRAFAEQPRHHFTPEQLMEWVRTHPLAGKNQPGERWQYSNINYVLLGRLIEQLEQKPLADVIQTRICQPLQMQSTFYSVNAYIPSPFASGYQFGDESGPIYWKGQGSIPHDVTDHSPSMWHGAGAMVSNLPDLKRFAQALARGEMLSTDARRQQLQWIRSDYPVDYAYGLGLIRYIDLVGHNGYVPGYQATLTIQGIDRPPGEQTIVIVLANCYSSPNWEEPANAMLYVIMRHLTGRSYAPPGWVGW